MNNFTYHKDIRICLAAFGNVLGGMILRRMTGDKENPTFDEIAIPVMYAPKTRVLHDIVNTSRHIKLPLISYSLKSIALDPGRNFNKLNGYMVSKQQDWTNSMHPTPIPVKMTINMSFLARFQEDVDEVITNLYTNFNPYVEISYRHPTVDEEVRCKVLWDGNASLNYPEQFNANDPYRLELDSSFTIETWLYKNDNIKANIIYNIPNSFTHLNELSNNYYYMHDQEEVPLKTDVRVVEGRPSASYTATTVVDVGNDSTAIFMRGTMFETVTDVVIVDMDSEHPMYDEESYKEYKDCVTYHFDEKGDIKDKEVLTFKGVPADFLLTNQTSMQIKFPVAKRGGRFDIYLVGKFGVGKLSEDSYRAYKSDDNQSPNYKKGILGIKVSGD